MDLLTLSRLQFALTVMFHYLFPPLTIGLGGLIVSLEALFLKTGEALYEQAARFWTKVFAVNFAMGVATGIVLEFEFGTNWAAYSRFVGDVFGSALAAEGIFAFFLESGFLAVLVFGWDRVSARTHFFAACMVALGAVFSSIWIVVANSWQQTPSGYHIVGEGLRARAEITDFWAMVLNPSSLHRWLHVLIGSYLLAAFFVMSICAYYILKGRHLDFARRSFTPALVLGALMSLAALVQGDLQAKKVAVTQPAKLAAMEAHFRTGTGGSPLYLAGLPDEREQRVRCGLAVPGLLSLLVHGDARQPVKGLDQVPPQDWPPVAVTFLSFHIMAGLGLCFILLTGLGCYFRWRGTLFEKRRLLAVFVGAVPLAYLANELGWVTAEAGRQPWIVYGLLRTSRGLSEAVSPAQTLGSMLMFLLIYGLLFAVWLRVLTDKVHQGPEPAPARAGTTPRALAQIADLRAGTGGASLTKPGQSDTGEVKPSNPEHRNST